MANFKKRKRRKGGIKGCCGMCKPWKATGCRRVAKNQRVSDQRADVSHKEQVREVDS